MRRAEYSEGSGLLVVERNRLLFLSSTDFAAALNLEVAALLGEEPIRSLAVALANEESEVPPFIFLEAAEELHGVVCGDIQLVCHDAEPSVVDGSVEDFWAFVSAAPMASVSHGYDSGPLWLETGAVRASAFRWYPTEEAKPPLVLVQRATTDDEGAGGGVQALVCFECQGPNPLMTARCRGCGAFLTEDNSDIQSVAQPTLGAIHLSDGRIEPLDADLLVGRNPDRYGLEPHQRAVVHGAGDQSISRRHLELRRDGWHVIAVCLKQPSGSTVQGRLGGRTPLEFGVPHQLNDGDIVHFGSAWFRYEQNAPINQEGT
ncbi:MAG: FHA domain-containing protein [Acidimicrobiia bacterium]|nr:FHA domain-containing protein [Acidimicrobiia bacterium]MYL08545.1 FHA domain-containing protein [Acidimicrobiia bacterium]